MSQELARKQKQPRKLKERRVQSFFIIYDSFLVPRLLTPQLCVSKILELLFLENNKNAQNLYNQLYERLGESILPLINKSYRNLSNNLISRKSVKNVIQNSLSINAENQMFI